MYRLGATAALLALATLLTTSADAQQRAQPRPQFQPPETIHAELPNVLLIGDSISIGYMLDVRKLLQGEANVFRPPTNCGPTTRGLENLQAWIGDRKWDVIHFNFGLHDLKYMGPNGENLAKPDSPGAHQQVPIDQYAGNLKKIANRLKQTGATVIWCQTTPVPEGASGRVPGDAAKYNQAAAEAMKEVGGIKTNPLYDFAQQHKQLQRPANVHYTDEGSAKLAEQVAKVIRAELQ